MTIRLITAGICIFVLALRNGVGSDEPLLFRVGLASALTMYWGAAFWLFKVYGIAVESMGSSQLVRRLLEYGLPLVVLVVILRLGGQGYLDVGLAAVIWFLVGTPLEKHRGDLQSSAVMHAKRFLSECGVEVQEGDRSVSIWPLHTVALAYAFVVSAVPGIQ